MKRLLLKIPRRIVSSVDYPLQVREWLQLTKYRGNDGLTLVIDNGNKYFAVFDTVHNNYCSLFYTYANYEYMTRVTYATNCFSVSNKHSRFIPTQTSSVYIFK